MRSSFAYVAAQILGPGSAFFVPAYITAETVGLADGILTLLNITSDAGVRDATVAPVLGVSRFRGV